MNLQKLQQRDARYFAAQSEELPYKDNKKSNFIIQRTIAHDEIKGNNQWMVRDSCYCCERWKFTLFFVEKESATSDDLCIEGSFELLNT